MVYSVKMKYTANRKVGHNMFDVLNEAAFVCVDHKWYPVLGYDEFDDVVCLENHTGEDITIQDASLVIPHNRVQVAVTVTTT